MPCWTPHSWSVAQSGCVLMPHVDRCGWAACVPCLPVPLVQPRQGELQTALPHPLPPPAIAESKVPWPPPGTTCACWITQNLQQLGSWVAPQGSPFLWAR